MKKFLNFILTILFWFFATRQMFLYNDIIGTIFLYLIGFSLALNNED